MCIMLFACKFLQLTTLYKILYFNTICIYDLRKNICRGFSMAGQARRVVLIKCSEDELAAVLHCVHICLSNKENCLIFALAYFSGPALSPLSFSLLQRKWLLARKKAAVLKKTDCSTILHYKTVVKLNSSC